MQHDKQLLALAAGKFFLYKAQQVFIRHISALTPGAAVASYVFRGNSLYDPDYTGTGHQPRYYDQLTPIYGRYKVLSSAITVEMINGAANSGAIFAITPNTEIITFTSWQQASELPRSKHL